MITRLARAVLLTVACTVLASAGALAQTAAKERLRFVMVTHGAGGTFWDSVREGAESAAQAAGADLAYRAPPTFDLEAMAALVTAAIAERPDGLVVSIPNADALAPAIHAAVDAGIPVISINSGFDVAQPLGARLHVGQSEYEAGRVAGESMRHLEATKALCLNHELGNVALDLRCKGFIDGFGGSVEVVTVGTDTEETRTRIAEKLANDAEIDAILALDATDAGLPAIEAVGGLEEGRVVHVATFDISDAVLTAVADGKAAFAIDQQPFLQGVPAGRLSRAAAAPRRAAGVQREHRAEARAARGGGRPARPQAGSRHRGRARGGPASGGAGAERGLSRPRALAGDAESVASQARRSHIAAATGGPDVQDRRRQRSP